MAAIMHQAFFIARDIEDDRLVAVLWVDANAYYLEGNRRTMLVASDVYDPNWTVPLCWQPVSIP